MRCLFVGLLTCGLLATAPHPATSKPKATAQSTKPFEPFVESQARKIKATSTMTLPQVRALILSTAKKFKEPQGLIAETTAKYIDDLKRRGVKQDFAIVMRDLAKQVPANPQEPSYFEAMHQYYSERYDKSKTHKDGLKAAWDACQ